MWREAQALWSTARSVMVSSLHPGDWSLLPRVVRANGDDSFLAEELLMLQQTAEIVEQHFAELDRGTGSADIDRFARFALKQLTDRVKRKSA